MRVGECIVTTLPQYMLILYMGRNSPTFNSHVWILSKLLTLPVATRELSKELFFYIVATCHRKIHRRFNHPQLSEPYYTSLLRVKSCTFQERRIVSIETQNDRILLSSLEPPTTLVATQKIPKLVKQAALARAGKPYALYTKDTCIEFHYLLCELLVSFKTALDDLLDSRGPDTPSAKGSDRFKKCMHRVMVYGYALQRITKGSGIEPHLQNIESSLRDNRRVGQNGRVGDLRDQKEDWEECDVELLEPSTTIQSDGRSQPVWKSYLDWLRLMLVHFDAVDTLTAYVGSEGFRAHYTGISVKILVLPSVGNRMLPWKTLFEDSQLLPSVIELDGGKTYVSSADLFDFLNHMGSLRPQNAIGEIRAFKKFIAKMLQDRTFPLSNADGVKANTFVQGLKGYAFPGWDEYTTRILANLVELAACIKSEESELLLSDITNTLDLLTNNVSFFKDLGTSKFDQDFHGRLHCEAGLASLLEFSPDKVGDPYSNLLQQLSSSVTCAIFAHIAFRS